MFENQGFAKISVAKINENEKKKLIALKILLIMYFSLG